MNVRFADRRPDGAYVLALPLASGAPDAARLAALPADAVDFVRRAAAAARFEGDAGSVVELYAPDAGETRRIALAGLGTGDSDAAYERAGGALVAKFQLSGETTLVVDLSGHRTTGERAARIAFGAVLRNWRYDLYRTKLKPSQKPSLTDLVIVGAGEGAEAAWTSLKAIADGIFLTRELVTEPANIIYPESFVERVRGPLTAAGVEIEVLGEAEMAKLGMGALLGVSQGSRREAQLLVLRWKGADADPIAFVGKGVTFDTGGISIKPAAGMEDMKWDMGGAGAVAGAMLALAGRKAKAHVIGVCGLVENMPDGNAQRPGDVVTSMSGQTIEVINTDAEGPARAVRRDHLGAAHARRQDDRRSGDADRRDDRRARPRARRAVLERRRARGHADRRRAGGRRQAVALPDVGRLRQADRLADRRHEECRPAARGLDHRRAVHQALCRGRREVGASRHRRHGVVGQGRRDVGQGRDRLRRAAARSLRRGYAREIGRD